MNKINKILVKLIAIQIFFQISIAIFLPLDENIETKHVKYSTTEEKNLFHTETTSKFKIITEQNVEQTTKHLENSTNSLVDIRTEFISSKPYPSTKTTQKEISSSKFTSSIAKQNLNNDFTSKTTEKIPKTDIFSTKTTFKNDDTTSSLKHFNTTTEFPIVTIKPYKDDRLTIAVDKLINNTLKSENELFDQLEGLVSNTTNQIENETEAIFEKHQGLISTTIKITMDILMSIQESINDKIEDLLEVSTNLVLNAYFVSIKASAKAGITMIEILDRCTKNKPVNLKETSLDRLANCVPENLIDEKNFDNIFKHVNEYVGYIVDTPDRIIKCLDKGFLWMGPCFFKMNTEIAFKSGKLIGQLTLDGVEITKFYSIQNTKATACFVEASFMISNDYYNLAGVDVKKCIKG